MGVFSRLSDIINANINTLLDKAEDPQKMIRLMIQEMEETLIEVRTDSAKVIADKKDIQRRHEFLLSSAADWESKAELALSKMREDLAKGALQEKAKALSDADVIGGELEKLDATLTKLQNDIGKLQQKITDAKARQKTLLMRTKTAQSHLTVKKQLDKTNSNEVMLKFDRFENKLNDMEAQVDSYDTQQRSLADEIGELETEEKINTELEALKAKLKLKDSSPK